MVCRNTRYNLLAIIPLTGIAVYSNDCYYINLFLQEFSLRNLSVVKVESPDNGLSELRIITHTVFSFKPCLKLLIYSMMKCYENRYGYLLFADKKVKNRNKLQFTQFWIIAVLASKKAHLHTAERPILHVTPESYTMNAVFCSSRLLQFFTLLSKPGYFAYSFIKTKTELQLYHSMD